MVISGAKRTCYWIGCQIHLMEFLHIFQYDALEFYKVSLKNHTSINCIMLEQLFESDLLQIICYRVYEMNTTDVFLTVSIVKRAYINRLKQLCKIVGVY